MYGKAYLFTIFIAFLFIPTHLPAQSYIYWGDKSYESTYVGYFEKRGIQSISLEVGKKRNGGAVLLLESDTRRDKTFDGPMYLYLDNGQRIKCIDRNLNDRVNGMSRALYFLTHNEVKRLKKKDIVKIRYSLRDFFGLNSYTINNSLDTSEDFVKLFGGVNSDKKGQDRKKRDVTHFESTKYSYSLEIPSGFSRIDNRSLNMDMNFSSDDGSSINMVVIPLTSQFKGTTDDLTKGMILNIFTRIDPNARVEDSGHVMVNGKKSFYYTLVFSPRNASYNLKQLTYTFYEGGNRFILTMTSGVDSFSNHKTDYKKTSQSIKF